MTAVKDDLVRNNKTINWIPASIGEGRFGNWLENIQDWGVSRNRYWGTPLNIWECECGHQHSIGSREELYKMSGNEKAKTVEFHRPYIDEITITCPECGKQMKRVPEVIDCWFDSGAMPFAQHHYPFETRICSSSSSPLTLSPRQWTRPVDGSTLCWQNLLCSSIRLLTRTLSLWAMYRMRTVRR